MDERYANALAALSERYVGALSALRRRYVSALAALRDRGRHCCLSAIAEIQCIPEYKYLSTLPF